jgi:hypothetical protein
MAHGGHTPQTGVMDVDFAGEVFEWRGPAPYYYVAVPDDESADIKEASPLLTYGWGVIPARVVVGGTEWTTSLFPKDGRYLVPLKDVVRRAEALEVGDVIEVSMVLGERPAR